MKLARENAQNQRVAQKKRWNRDTFEIGDHVRIRDVEKSMWSCKGIILEAQIGQERVRISFVVEMQNGAQQHRHATFCLLVD